MKFKWATSWENQSSRVCDQVRLKQACSVTEASQSLEALEDIKSYKYYLSRERQRWWSDCAYARQICTFVDPRFSHDVVHFISFFSISYPMRGPMICCRSFRITLTTVFFKNQCKITKSSISHYHIYFKIYFGLHDFSTWTIEMWP